MTTKIEVPIKFRSVEKNTTEKSDEPKEILDLEFPQACIYCNAPADTHIDLNISYSKVKKEASKTDTLILPYCSVHEKVNTKISKVLNIITAVLTIYGIGMAFYVAFFQSGIEEVGLKFLVWGLYSIVYILILIGIGKILHIVIALFSQSFRARPITNGSLGFRPQYSKEQHVLYFSFSNDSYANSFLSLNGNAKEKYHFENDPNAFRWIINGLRRNRFLLEIALWGLLELILIIIIAIFPAEDGSGFQTNLVLFVPVFAVGSMGVKTWKTYSSGNKLLYSVASLGMLPLVIIVGDIFRWLFVRHLYNGDEPVLFGILGSSEEPYFN